MSWFSDILQGGKSAARANERVNEEASSKALQNKAQSNWLNTQQISELGKQVLGRDLTPKEINALFAKESSMGSDVLASGIFRKGLADKGTLYSWGADQNVDVKKEATDTAALETAAMTKATAPGSDIWKQATGLLQGQHDSLLKQAQQVLAARGLSDSGSLAEWEKGYATNVSNQLPQLARSIYGDVKGYTKGAVDTSLGLANAGINRSLEQQRYDEEQKQKQMYLDILRNSGNGNQDLINTIMNVIGTGAKVYGAATGIPAV